MTARHGARRPRRWARLALLALVLAAPACARSAAAPTAVGHGAPSISFARGDGGELRLDATRGDVVVLAFFTTYCPTSAAALRAVDALRARNASGLEVIAVGEGETTSGMGDFTGKLGVNVTVAFDRAGAAANQLGLVAVPSILVIDRQGTVRHVHSGYRGEGDRSALDREVTALLAEASRP